MSIETDIFREMKLNLLYRDASKAWIQSTIHKFFKTFFRNMTPIKMGKFHKKKWRFLLKVWFLPQLMDRMIFKKKNLQLKGLFQIVLEVFKVQPKLKNQQKSLLDPMPSHSGPLDLDLGVPNL
jgi:hypothetical protein